MKPSPILAIGISILAACHQRDYSEPEPTSSFATETYSSQRRASFPVSCFRDSRGENLVVSLQYIEYFDEVVGILDYAFADQDNARGVFRGSMLDNVMTAIWTYDIEGASQSERIVIRTDDKTAAIASGELAESADGILL